MINARPPEVFDKYQSSASMSSSFSSAKVFRTANSTLKFAPECLEQLSAYLLPLLSPSVHRLFAGPRQAAKASTQDSAGEIPQRGVGKHGCQNCQVDGGRLLI